MVTNQMQLSNCKKARTFQLHLASSVSCKFSKIRIPNRADARWIRLVGNSAEFDFPDYAERLLHAYNFIEVNTNSLPSHLNSISHALSVPLKGEFNQNLKDPFCGHYYDDEQNCR